MHARQQIREALVTILTGLPTTGANVFVMRPEPIPSTSLPALEIATGDDMAEHDVTGLEQKHWRTVTLLLRAVAQEGSNVQDVCDDICAEVEAAIAADDTLGIGCKWSRIDSTTPTIDEETQRPTGEAIMAFNTLYRVAATDPTTIIQ